MSLIVSGVSNGGSYETVPAGSYAARCYQIIDLGHQTIEWQGEAKVIPKVRITWELSELMSDGRPYSISKEYTASIGPKANLRKDLEAWRGRPFTEEEILGFSLDKILGMSCLLGIVHTSKSDKTYANINSIMKLPKGMDSPELVNPMVKFDISNFDTKVFETFSDYLKKKILMSKELEETGIPVTVQNDVVSSNIDEVPF